MYELTTLDIYTAADKGLISFCHRTGRETGCSLYLRWAWDSEPSPESQCISVDHLNALGSKTAVPRLRHGQRTRTNYLLAGNAPQAAAGVPCGF